MAKINILPSKVYNRIAAGEVVERPCSVVKELVENAIDAGATEIQVYIEQGGKQLIRVVDNGSGIERDDLHSAFLPHATSKIATAEDLESIMTLGFRGEAVASIASVSKMTITSKTKDGKCYSLHSNGGEIGQISEASGENGTDVSVEMLFFNAPVRLNFLKTDKGEETEITNFISRFILNRADIAFTYYADGKKMLQSFGGGDEEALISVYGAATLRDCIQINAEKHGIRIRGYIGNQNFFKANKSYQSVFLNGRYITNATISSALSNAYSSYLMKRQYPFYVLHIEVPREVVDVNVHPNKSDVRFASNQIIYGCIYNVVAAVLDGQTKALEYVVNDPRRMENAPIEEVKSEVKQSAIEDVIKATVTEPKPIASEKRQEKTELPKSEKSYGFTTLTYEEAQKEIERSMPSIKEKRIKNLDQLPFEEVIEKLNYIPKSLVGKCAPTQKPVPLQSAEKRAKNVGDNGAEELHELYPDLYFKRTKLELNDPEYARVKQEVPNEDPFLANKRFLEEMEKKAKQNKIDVSACTYVGKLFNTYLMYEHGTDLYIIDQHAAHERLIFNRLKEQMQNRSVVQQPMLLPYELQLNAFECEFIREHLTEIAEMGFDLSDEENNTWKVTAIPLDLQNIDLGAFFHDILGDIGGYRAIKLTDILKDKLASAACKAAVKGGMDLTREEIDALFAMMDGDMGLKCPHGRPVVVKMSKTEIEKMFKRIV
ncbi:MAG: DNA mismatch repair endonuclease MutL [Clostridia bacterium]|nr:DNA mismatch repair endonuclease MutL [Clostridia bacterium]